MRKIRDLTHQIYDGMPTFNAPWHPKVTVRQIGRIPREGRETRAVSLGTHSGTHIDAPLHFLAKGRAIDQAPLGSLLGKVAIADLSKLGPNSIVTKKMLEKVRLGERTIFKFAWSRHWGTKRFYTSYPCFSIEAAEFIASRGVKVVGMDTPSPDKNPNQLAAEDEDSPVHKLWLRKGITIIECLANLEGLHDYKGWTLVALPLKIAGADAAPARVLICK